MYQLVYVHTEQDEHLGARNRALATDAAGQLHVLGHDGDSLGMNGTQVSVLEEPNQVGLGSFLQGTNCARLEAQAKLKVLGNLTNQALEGKLADEEVSHLLKSADFTKCHSTRAVAMGLLHSASGWGRLASGLGS